MSDRSVDITIRAKDLTAQAFKSAQAQLAELTGRAKKASDTTTQISGSMRGLLSSLGPLGPAIAGTFSVGAIVGFAKSLLDTADATIKMADKTGMSIEAVQRLGYIATQSGNSLDQVSTSVSMLQKRLAAGDDSALAGLKSLGIEFEDFAKMTPDRQFMAIAREVKTIEDPMQRAKVATELFGKAGTELLPSLIANVDELAAKAPVMSAKATKAFDDIGDSIASAWGKLKTFVGEGLATAIDSYARLVGGVSKALRGNFEGAVDTLLGLDTELPKVTDKAKALAVGTSSVALAMEDADRIGKDLTDTAKAQGRAYEKAGKDAKAAAEVATEAWLEAWEAMTQGGRDAVASTQNSFTMLGDLWTQVLPDAGESPLPKAQLMIQGVRDTLAQAFTGLMPAVTGNMTTAFAPLGRNLGAALKTGLFDTLENFPAILQSALTGGGGVQGAIKSVGANLGAILGEGLFSKLGNAASGLLGKLGPKVGGAIFDMIPGIGGVIGSLAMPLLGKIGGTIKGIFTGGEGAKVNDLRDSFVSASGGIDALNRKAQAAGVTLDALLKAKTVKDYEAAVASLNGRLEQTAQIQGQIDGLQAILDGRDDMDWAKAEELAAKYGITIEGLGQQFVNAKEASSWKTVWDDWSALIDMGGDVGGTLSGMGDEISGLVARAQEFGLAVPAQFKPLIEELARSGQLLTENGEAITDLSGIKWGAPLVSEVDKIVAAIKELVESLKGPNGVAAAFQAVGNTRVSPIKIPYTYEATNEAPDGTDPSVPGYATGSLITREHLARVGEGGEPELIGPVGFMTQALAGALSALGGLGGGGNARIVVEPRIYLDKREIARVLIPEIPLELRRQGLAT